jgi:hypothetical protein
MLISAAVLFFGFSSGPVLAVCPSAVMVYGEGLSRPILLQPASTDDIPSFEPFWRSESGYPHPGATLRGNPVLAGLRSRAYVKLAIFWGRYDADQLKPENASQHGRLYLPTGSEPAMVISTPPDMEKKSNPIPTELEGFASAWTLGPQQLATLKNLGLPGI